MMMNREDCYHTMLRFESGDYYLSCEGCGAKWAAINPSAQGDFVQPEIANKGVGSTLSGDARVKQP
jgi:hypothetical protein